MNHLLSKHVLFCSVFDHVHLTTSIFGSIVENILSPSFPDHVVSVRDVLKNHVRSRFRSRDAKVLYWRCLVLAESELLRVLSNLLARHLLLTRPCFQSLVYKTHCSTEYMFLRVSFLQYWNSDFLSTNQSFRDFNKVRGSWRVKLTKNLFLF